MGGLFGGGGGGAGGSGSLLGNNGMVGGLMGGIGLNLSQIPFVGGMFPDPNAPAMQAAMQNAANTYASQRPVTAQAFENLMNQVRAGYQPAQNALASMYGGGNGTPNLAGAPTSAPPPEGWSPGQPSPGQQMAAQQASSAPRRHGASHGPFGAIGDILGFGNNAPFGLPGPGLMGGLSGNVMGNMPGFGWAGPVGMPGGQMLGGIPGMQAPNLFGGGQQQMQPMGMSPMPFFPGAGGLLGGLMGGGRR